MYFVPNSHLRMACLGCKLKDGHAHRTDDRSRETDAVRGTEERHFPPPPPPLHYLRNRSTSDVGMFNFVGVRVN